MRRLIDDWLPSFDEGEFHTRQIAAERAAVEVALRELTADELRLTGLLMGIRTLPARPWRMTTRSTGVLAMSW